LGLIPRIIQVLHYAPDHLGNHLLHYLLWGELPPKGIIIFLLVFFLFLFL
jgi:hypothetical protein